MAAIFVVTWSSGFVGATLADRAAGPAQLLAWRYVVTAGVVVLVAAAVRPLRRELAAVAPREWGRQAVLGLLSHVVFLGGVFAAAAGGLDAGVSALVCALQPMIVAAGGRVFFSDRSAPLRWVGLGLGLLGVVISVGGVDGPTTSSVWLVVASLVALCTAALLERAWRPPLSVPASLTIQVVVSAVVFTVSAVATTGLGVEFTSAFVGALVWLVLLSGLGGYGAFIWCLRHLGATPTSALLYLTPPVTSLWAWAMFAQRPAVSQVVGLGIVLVGVTLSGLGAPARAQVARPVRAGIGRSAVAQREHEK